LEWENIIILVHSFDYSYICRQKLRTVIKLVLKANEKEQSAKAYGQYLVDYKFMKSGEIPYVSFEDYFNKTETKVKSETKEEIQNKVDKILSSMGGAKKE
jgi:uncharacterized HAD superfamily protein